MKNVIYELVNQIGDLEKELKEKETDLNKLIDYLHYKGIHITVHSEYLSSELDEENNLESEK